MYGVVTRHAGELDWPEFDRAFYEVKDASGRATDPVPDAVNAVACFGDTEAVANDGSLAPVDAEGRSATRDREGFEWSHVDPTHERYRDRLLELVAECAAVSPDVRLDDVGFPGRAFCHCDRCDRLFAESGFEARVDWRADVVTSFVRAAADRIPGRVSLGVHPDPYGDRLRTRSGVDLEALVDVVDEVVVPLYDPAYGTTYWVESLAGGFSDRLADADVEVAAELYAVELDLDALVAAVDAAAVADHVYFGYDAGTAVAALRRRRADTREGVTHRPDPGGYSEDE
jgi:hypothetical protein